MEADAQYALHDNEATPLAWAARVRLTPELLEKLRQAPEQVLLKLNVPTGDGASKSRGSSKKTSVMTVKLAADGETEEQYELLSFPEDPGINHVCTFRREAPDDSVDGYNIYKTGAIHQKLLVQRLLDATEKDRIKDKHAKSVLASKSRASKLIDTELEKPTKRQRLTRLSSMSISRQSAGSSAWSVAAGHKRTRRLVLPSALTEEKAKEAKDKIDKGFEVVEHAPTTFPVDKYPGEYEADNKEGEESPIVVISKETAAAARDAEFRALFSSDSDDGDTTVRSRVLRREKKKAAKEVKENQRVEMENTNNHDEDKKTAESKNKDASDSELDGSAQPKESVCATAEGDAADALQPVKKSENVQDKQSGEALDIYALKPIKPSASGVEVKRARVRSALVSDRVKQPHLPDLSFFPSAVVGICQRLAHFHGRSVILDESDYDSFVVTHEQFRQDWEMLDKAYSIEMIKTEGLHLQLEVATPGTNREQVEARIKTSSSKKEGLLFVRDAMASIQKILHSIQAAVDRFNIKSHTSQTTS